MRRVPPSGTAHMRHVYVPYFFALEVEEFVPKQHKKPLLPNEIVHVMFLLDQVPPLRDEGNLVRPPATKQSKQSVRKKKIGNERHRQRHRKEQ